MRTHSSASFSIENSLEMFQGKFIDPLYLNEAVNHEANLNRDIYNDEKTNF